MPRDLDDEREPDDRRALIEYAVKQLLRDPGFKRAMVELVRAHLEVHLDALDEAQEAAS
jgi:hypothetical protein